VRRKTAEEAGQWLLAPGDGLITVLPLAGAFVGGILVLDLRVLVYTHAFEGVFAYGQAVGWVVVEGATGAAAEGRVGVVASGTGGA
jgi:hypothetical protein